MQEPPAGAEDAEDAHRGQVGSQTRAREPWRTGWHECLELNCGRPNRGGREK